MGILAIVKSLIDVQMMKVVLKIWLEKEKMSMNMPRKEMRLIACMSML